MTKKVDTWMPLLVDKYLGDTTMLSTEQHGAYLLLLMSMWKKDGRLPDDDKQLAQAARLSAGKWKAARPVLVDGVLLRSEGGFITQKRLSAELANAKKHTEAKAEAGAKGAAKRWQQEAQNDGKADGTATASANGKPDGTAIADESQKVSQTGASISIPKEIPPIPPKGAKSSAIGLRAWLDAVKAKGEKPVPEDDPVFAYAGSVGIPSELMFLAWREFRHRYCLPDAKKYRDWRAVFRKAVRGNWLKLWFVDGQGVYQLTTVGHQAQRAHDERRAA